MNIGEAFLIRGEHPPSFVSLIHLLLPFHSLPSFHLLHFGLNFKTCFATGEEASERQKLIVKNIIQYLLKALFICSSFFFVKTQMHHLWVNAIRQLQVIKKENTFFLYNNHWISHTMIWWKMCLLSPRLNGVLPTSLWSVAPSSTSFHDLWLSYFLFCTLLLVELFT